MFGNFIGHVGEFGTACPLGDSAAHAVIVPECACGSTDLRAHVADGAFAGAAQALGTRPKYSNDRTCSALHSKDTGHFKD